MTSQSIFLKTYKGQQIVTAGFSVLFEIMYEKLNPVGIDYFGIHFSKKLTVTIQYF